MENAWLEIISDKIQGSELWERSAELSAYPPQLVCVISTFSVNPINYTSRKKNNNLLKLPHLF